MLYMTNYKTTLLLLVVLLAAFAPAGAQMMKPFKLSEVELLPGVFSQAQQTDMRYMLSLDADRLLAPYLREAGLSPKKENYPNWENTGLDGHIGGHYLSALSNMYAATSNKQMNQRLDYMLSELKRCQEKTGTGYIGGTPGGAKMWSDIEAGHIKSDTFALNEKWVPLYNIHKIFAGLRDAYLIAGKDDAKEILIKLTDYVDRVSSHLSDDQIQTMLFSEHGGLNEIFADVAFITGDKKYLTLAQRYSHLMLLRPLIEHVDNLTGLHANMQIPKAVGFQRVAELSGDASYADAARFFWQTVVSHRTVVIGGNSVQEHFNPIDNYKPMIAGIAGPETCNTYNMLKLSRHLFEYDGESKYIDFYERATYNHILSSQHPVRGGFVYYTSMRPRHYRVYSQPQINMWCCVGSGMENHGKYGELIYSHSDHNLFVNLFIPSRLTWTDKGMVIAQETKFPDDEVSRITIEKVATQRVTINVRVPSWVDAGKFQIKINGKVESLEAKPGSYVSLERTWKKGDIIEVHLPMKLTYEQMPDGSNFVAFLHGPIVLAAKTDSGEKLNYLGTENQFGGYRASGTMYPMDEAPSVRLQSADLSALIIPLKGKTQTFSALKLITQPKYQNLELVPFYKVHDSRYVIYWPLTQN